MADSWTLLINGWVGVRSTHSTVYIVHIVDPLLSYNCLDSRFKGREQHVYFRDNHSKVPPRVPLERQNTSIQAMTQQLALNAEE